MVKQSAGIVQRLNVCSQYVSPLGQRAITGSRPSADVTLILLRVADLAAGLPDGPIGHSTAVFLLVFNSLAFSSPDRCLTHPSQWLSERTVIGVRAGVPQSFPL